MKVLVGSRHDAYCLGESGLLDALDPGNWAGDKGFVGYAMITPFKKPPGGELLEWQKEYNTQLYKICWVIEQVIGNFKTPDHAHGLPTADRDLLRDHLSRRRPALLQTRLNNPAHLRWKAFLIETYFWVIL